MVQKGHHCAYDIHYHIVFPVKYRKTLLQKEIVEKIKEISIEIQERYEIEMERIGCDEDHIHILCSAHPKYSPGEIVQKYKIITAKQLIKNPAAELAGFFIIKTWIQNLLPVVHMTH